ncbi:hypothetical protein PWT90_05107 [Aphanocladium album]|nr:hypothetical protein PWT90_05107 [Aphanocladium album]
MFGYYTTPDTGLTYFQERPYAYGPGGLHPVNLGDVFKDGRYEVVHKLGFGKSATVWLAEDLQEVAWVALKICKANATESQELAMLDVLQQSPASEYVAELYDHFFHAGPNGTHLCIVMSVLGPSLSNRIMECRKHRNPLTTQQKLQLAMQLLQALNTLHSAGFSHGDLSPGDVVFNVENLQKLNRQQLFELVGEPETAVLSRADGLPLECNMPKQMVNSMQWKNWNCQGEEKLCLVDWGEAFRIGSPPRKLEQTPEIQAPETTFMDAFDHRVDLWAAGCCIYFILFSGNPFDDWGENTIIPQMFGLIEPLPAEWEEKWQAIKRETKHQETGWEEEEKLLREFVKKVPAPELTPLLPVIQRLMRFRPSDRISARQALSILYGAPASPPPAGGCGDADVAMADS